MKTSQNVNIESELLFFIWNYKLTIMAKRKTKDQINNMILEHYYLRNKGQTTSNKNLEHGRKDISLKITTL